MQDNKIKDGDDFPILAIPTNIINSQIDIPDLDMGIFRKRVSLSRILEGLFSALDDAGECKEITEIDVSFCIRIRDMVIRDITRRKSMKKPLSYEDITFLLDKTESLDNDCMTMRISIRKTNMEK